MTRKSEARQDKLYIPTSWRRRKLIIHKYALSGGTTTEKLIRSFGNNNEVMNRNDLLDVAFTNSGKGIVNAKSIF